MKGRVRKGVVSAVVAASLLAAGVPSVGFAAESPASLKMRIADARARFEELAMASAELGEALNDTYYQLDQTRQNKERVTGQIKKTRKELDNARDVLGKRVAANYRAGSRTMIDMLLGCSSVEDFVDTVYYCDKVHENDVAAINAVQTAQTDLEHQESELIQIEQAQSDLAEQQEDKAALLEEAVAAQASYLNGLDSELRAQLEQQRAAEVSAQQAAAARAVSDGGQVIAPLQWQDEDGLEAQGTPAVESKAADTSSATQSQTQQSAQETSSSTEQATSASTSSATEAAAAEQTQKAQTQAEQPAAEQSAAEQPAAEQSAAEQPVAEQSAAEQPAAEQSAAEQPAAEQSAAEQPAQETEAASTATEAEVTESASSSSSSSTRDAILAAAYSQLGVPYVYGAESPGEALDCSGFTQYCYSQAGIDIPHSSVGQADMADKSSIDELQAGDLVFWEGTAGGSASGSHVAIYLGDGQIIHANGTEVAVGTLSDTYTSCGSIS